MHRLSLNLSKPFCCSVIATAVHSPRPCISLLRNARVALPPRPLQPLTHWRHYAAKEPDAGTTTPVPQDIKDAREYSTSHFYFEAGYALFAKRPSRPFPPPFLSRPSSSFSDPLSTHNRSRDRRATQADAEQYYQGEMIRGVTNGDDAVLVSDQFIAANDGVGAWGQKERGHAALWSRLIIHFWALEAEAGDFAASSETDVVGYLQRAFDLTKEATSKPNEWFGTTTASGALLSSSDTPDPTPVLYVTQLGDSQILVIRPRDSEVLFKTEEQWHWFDCPRQLGTNSPDTPTDNAVVNRIEIEENDVVLAMSDGVVDNLWVHEVVDCVVQSLKKAESYFGEDSDREKYAQGMKIVATDLVKAATVIAQDPFAESPFMERAIEEGLPTEGGKLDDISVVAAICRRRKK